MTSDPRPFRSGFRLPCLRGPASGGPGARLLVITFLCLVPILVAPPPTAAQDLTGEEERIVAWVGAHVDDAMDLLERTVNINSGTMAPHAGASLAGVGVTGRGGHSPEEEMDLDSLPLAIERAALLIYRLTRGAGGF